MNDAARLTHDAFLKRKYFSELDGLRALSVLLVISIHLYDSGANWLWLGGWQGVTLFFVLSGFLITTLALREEADRGRLSLAAFYVRRCCRIFPLYYVTLGLYCLLVFGLGLSPNLREPLLDALPYYAFYLQEVPFCLWQVLTTRDLAFMHSWTLGTEEKFYLLWPLLAFVLWRGALGRRMAGTALLAAGFLLIPALLTPLGPAPRVFGRMLFGYGSLLSGCLLALLLNDPAWFARLRRLSSAAGTMVVVLFFLAAHFTSPWVSPQVADAVNVCYTLSVTALLACVLLGDGPLQWALRVRPLVAVGRLSYGIYLIHVLAMCAVYRFYPASVQAWTGSIPVFVLTALLSVALAWLLKVTIESPCIEFGRRWSRRIIDRVPTERQTCRRAARTPMQPPAAAGRETQLPQMSRL